MLAVEEWAREKSDLPAKDLLCPRNRWRFVEEVLAVENMDGSGGSSLVVLFNRQDLAIYIPRPPARCAASDSAPTHSHVTSMLAQESKVTFSVGSRSFFACQSIQHHIVEQWAPDPEPLAPAVGRRWIIICFFLFSGLHVHTQRESKTLILLLLRNRLTDLNTMELCLWPRYM